MRSASVERIFFVLRKRPKRPRDLRDHETERPREDTITSLSATSHKKSLPLNSNLDILARPLVDLNALAQ